MPRLSELRKQKGLKQGDLAASLGVAQSTLSGWENGKFEIDDKNKIKLADFFGVSVDYLLGREVSANSPWNENGIDMAPRKKGIKIPVLGRVVAGVPVEAVQDVIDYEEIDEEMAKTGEFFALQIKGDSMEPRIKSGDVVIVRKQDIVDSGDVAIVMVNGDDATCKKFVKHKNGVSLVSMNPAYTPMFYTMDEVESLPVRILGRVMELRAKF